MRTLLAQIAPVAADARANAARAAAIIDAADAELVVFPELYLTGYDLERSAEQAVDPESEPVAQLRAAAARGGTAVISGFAERRGDLVSNAVALIDEQGRLVTVYRKMQLFGDERNFFAPGEELVVAELGGSRVGPLICFDMEFPELARALARAGAELLVTAAANMEPYYGDHQIASQARALDNRLPHAYCNRCGKQGGLTFVGGSRVLRADGSIQAQAMPGEQLLRAEPDLAPTQDLLNYLAQLPQEISVKAPVTATGGTR